MRYSFEGRIRYSEIGEDQKLTMSALVNYFQDCSTFQSEDLGVGIGWMKEQQRVWILASWQIHVNRYPVLGEKIRTSTWAYEFKGSQGLRNFLMEGEDGEVLAYANSLWVYMNTQTGAFERIPAQLADRYEPEEAYPAVFGSRKVVLPKEGGVQKASFPVMEYHLDTNHHVNNGQYIRMMEAYLPDGFCVHDVRVEYKKQAFPGDFMTPECYWFSDSGIIALKDGSGMTYAAAEYR